MRIYNIENYRKFNTKNEQSKRVRDDNHFVKVCLSSYLYDILQKYSSLMSGDINETASDLLRRMLLSKEINVLSNISYPDYVLNGAK